MLLLLCFYARRVYIRNQQRFDNKKVKRRTHTDNEISENQKKLFYAHYLYSAKMHDFH